MITAVIQRLPAILGVGLAGAGVAIAPAPALAGSAVTPTLVRLASARDTGEVTLWNGGTKSMLVEAQVVSWSQPDGSDRFAETSDLVIAPAIVEIGPGQGQIFRVRARVAPATTGERAYRLRLEDITPAQPGTGIGLRVRHDLPLLLGSAGKADLTFTPCPARPSGCVRATNLGTAHAKVNRITIRGANGERKIDAVATILAGSWHEWAFPAGAIGSPQRLVAETAQGPVTASLEQP